MAVRDCVIIGGGAAGLAAAMVLARARRTLSVIDAGRQNNLRTDHSGGVFLHDGGTPAQMYTQAREDLSHYEGTALMSGTVVRVVSAGAGFAVHTEEGAVVETRKVIFAQGMKFEKSAVPGIDELWGTKVIHCPFCDGYEARDDRVLAVGTRQWLEHMRILLPNWIDRIGWAEDSTVVGVADEGGPLRVEFDDGHTELWDKVLTEVLFGPRDQLAASLGCDVSDAGHLRVDDFGQTNVPGIYAAGDQTVPPQQVNLAVGSGHLAGMGVIFALSEEDRGAGN